MASLYSLLCAAMTLFSSLRCENGDPQHKALFVIGDSLFDAGNNPYISEVSLGIVNWPYGETFPGYPTGRFSDGRAVPDFIAQFAGLRILDPYLSPNASERLTDGANFASGGGGVLGGEDPRWMNLGKQLSCFKEAVNTLKKQQGETKALRILNSAVYLFSMGGNDYFGYSRQNHTAEEQAHYVRSVIGNLTRTLKEVYMLGGRKIAFQNVGSLGCIPTQRAHNGDGSCHETALALAREHNRALAVTLKELERKLPGFKYSIFDYYNSILSRTDQPHKYEFKEGKTACCGHGPYRANGCGRENFETCSNPSEYVWFDGGHTTEETNRQLAELIWSGSPNTTGPYNVKQLFELS